MGTGGVAYRTDRSTALCNTAGGNGSDMPPFLKKPAPRMVRIRRALPGEHIADPRRDVRERLLAAGLAPKISRGDRIAITAGSRGMGGLIHLLAGVADAVKQCGGEPFIIPAMGSHGGATPEGQARILQLLGLEESVVGAPVRATMDTVTFGKAKNGAVAHLDRFAHEADGVIVLGRTKTHPESDEGLASGLLKMVVIGLGKQRGAQEAHSHGLWDSVRHVPEVVLPNANVLFGVAVVENGYRQPVVIEVVPPLYDAFLESDERLLKVAKPLVAKLPFDNLHVLIVDEIGKTVSGSGMDLNVIGKHRATGKGPHEPEIKRIVALSLTKPSLGNGLGIGLADFTTRRFLQQYDPVVSYINLLTATEPDNTTHEGPLPLALDTDREAIEVAMYSALADGDARVCRIKSTVEMAEMWISEALIAEARRDASINIESEPQELPFNSAGNLW